jgi:hypothetical protein
MNNSKTQDSVLAHCCRVFNNVRNSLSVSSKTAWQTELEEPMAAVFRTLAEELIVDLVDKNDSNRNKILFQVKQYLLDKANEYLEEIK